MVNVTAYVSTRQRYEVLSQCLLSVALQTRKPDSIIILDDSDKPPRNADELVRSYPAYGEIFQLFQEYKVSWEWKYGKQQGQHFNHQAAQEIAKTQWLWRIDDDEVAEPDVLEKLLSNVTDSVGAVGGLVLPPNPAKVPDNAANLISDLNLPNIQWFRHPVSRVFDVEHLHSTFLYRRGIEQYDLSLSPAAHREETLFTHGILRKGYKVLVDTSAVTWHFRAEHGGIRSHHDPNFWVQDEQIFNTKLKEWGVNSPTTKVVVMDNGRGDHVVLRKIIPDLKKKYEKVIVASCFPDILEGIGVEQISIAQAKHIMPIDHLNIYRNMIDWNWKGPLEDAFRKLYGIA